MPTHAEDIVGKRHGRLVVQSLYCRTPERKYKWLCKCDCGNTCVVFGSKLKSGHTKSCGCLRHESPPNKIHGSTAHPLFPVWTQMRQRCDNPQNHAYKWYGGRGIKVCEEWKSDFVPFYDWAMNNGWHKGLTVDRIDGNKDYCPENCRLVTHEVQQNNRRNNIIIEHEGVKDTISGWAKRTGISRNLIASRYRRGENADRILSPYHLQRRKGLK